ncbi:MAG TPA: hypothetical protein VH601_11380 [Bryobacteraceae bacterium]
MSALCQDDGQTVNRAAPGVFAVVIEGWPTMVEMIRTHCSGVGAFSMTPHSECGWE